MRRIGSRVKSMDTMSATKFGFNNLNEVRLHIDKLINSTKFLIQSREVSLTHTNLQRAKHWAGKALGELGGETPYGNSEKPHEKTIEAQADHGNNHIGFENIPHTQVAHVKYFREKCSQAIFAYNEWNNSSEAPNGRYMKYIEQSIFALEEAKMWLGWELNRIKDFQEEKENGTGKIAVPELNLY